MTVHSVNIPFAPSQNLFCFEPMVTLSREQRYFFLMITKNESILDALNTKCQVFFRQSAIGFKQIHHYIDCRFGVNRLLACWNTILLKFIHALRLNRLFYILLFNLRIFIKLQFYTEFQNQYKRKTKLDRNCSDMKLKIVSLGLALLGLSQLFTCTEASRLQHLKQAGGYNWDYFDEQIRKISQMLGYKGDQFNNARLVHREHQGEDVKFIYDRGNGQGDEVAFVILSQGAVNIKQWRRAQLDTIMPLKHKKIVKPNDIPSVPIPLATQKDFQAHKFLKKCTKGNKFHSLTADQMENDRRLPIVKRHIEVTADIDVNKFKLIDIQRKQDDEDSFTYKLIFNAVRKSKPQRGVLRVVIEVSVDQDEDDAPVTVETKYYKLHINGQSNKTEEDQLNSVETKEQLLKSKHVVYNQEQQIVRHFAQKANVPLSGDSHDRKNLESREQQLSNKKIIKDRPIIVEKEHIKIPEKCVQFDEKNGECFRCIDGYYLNKNGVCSKNKPYCKLSDRNGNCQECLKTYSLVNGQCFLIQIEPQNGKRKRNY